MKLSLPSKQTLCALARGIVVGSIGVSLGFYLVMMHPIPRAARLLSTHFYHQYEKANIVLPEITEDSSTKEKLEYMKQMHEWSGLKTNIIVAVLAEEQIYWSLASGLIAFALWFPVTWLGRKFETR
ncbi:hypothetical protein [Acaryochloris sp. CCMEE 5410]|uniref:hypothetical protein n=1 Tax=Acaryochloris sp. CCMEE 5410 TaxID=310037 RepID=UPI00024837BB|nr:hypothetical protein [Acaryochloris sp. CCMEE 5410]KAI9129616.1 hypothetical protein ON05_033505 [Acaryochloris sp. CCMEE 5410]